MSDYEWLPGGFFLQQRVEIDVAAGGPTREKKVPATSHTMSP
jgi:hypothetical protein